MGGGTNDPDPNRSALRWAWIRARQHRTKFWIGSVTFTAVSVVVGAVATEPADPTWGQRVEIGFLALGIAVGLVVLATMTYAVLVAPYEQRNALRRQIAKQATEQKEPSRGALVAAIDAAVARGREIIRPFVGRPFYFGAERMAVHEAVAVWLVTTRRELDGIDPDAAVSFGSADPGFDVDIAGVTEWTGLVQERIDRLNRLRDDG